MRELTSIRSSRRAAKSAERENSPAYQALAREAYPSLDAITREHDEMVEEIRSRRSHESVVARELRKLNEGE
jgi:hypothetical protein